LQLRLEDRTATIRPVLLDRLDQHHRVAARTQKRKLGLPHEGSGRLVQADDHLHTCQRRLRDSNRHLDLGWGFYDPLLRPPGEPVENLRLALEPWQLELDDDASQLVGCVDQAQPRLIAEAPEDQRHAGAYLGWRPASVDVDEPGYVDEPATDQLVDGGHPPLEGELVVVSASQCGRGRLLACAISDH